MKKLLRKLICISGIFACHGASAQAPGIDWKNVYTDYIGTGTCIQPTSDGGYIAGGVYASHFLVFKLDNSGTKEWDKWITAGTGITAVNSVKQTTDGGYIVAGSDLAFSPDSIGNHGIRDFMVTKLSDTGHVEWIKCLGGTSNEEAQSIEQTPDGGYIVVGYTGSNDNDVSGWHGNADYWVVKIDSTGTITWQKTLGGINYDYATSVTPTSDGGYAVAGYSGSKDGDVIGNHWGGSDDDVWVVKLNSSGDTLWQKSYGGSKEDHAYSIKQTSDGGYIVAGSTTSNDGNVSGLHTTGQDNQDYWVIKLDATGGLTWQKCLGGVGSGIGAGSGNDIAYSVQQTSDGNYIVAGTVSSGDSTNADITGYHGHTGSDYWVVKLNTTGAIIWQKCLGGNGTEDARTVAQTQDGGYIITGTTLYSPDGDVAASEYSYNHPWVVKLLGETSSGILESKALSFSVYPNPAKNQVTIKGVPIGSSVRILSTTSEVINTYKITEMVEAINTENLSSGMYIIQIKTNNSLVNKKFIVNK